jgi:putative membrane protein
MNRHRFTACVLNVSVPAIAWAHGSQPTHQAWWSTWEWEPVTIVTLVVSAVIYAAGLKNWRRRIGGSSAETSRPSIRHAAWCFAGGWWLLVVALVSPMHPWGQVFFSVHMIQHEVLMILAAPLLALGRPMPIALSALPRDTARKLVSRLRRLGGSTAWRVLNHPFNAWLLHAVALWLWHVPLLFEATLRSDAAHALQHVSFLGTALLFWHAVFFGPQRSWGHGMAVIYLFTTAVHSGALGALLTFSSRLWYPSYTAGVGELSPLEDQQLGGLIMWLPAGTVYLVAALVLFARWIHRPPSVPCVTSSSSAC